MTVKFLQLQRTYAYIQQLFFVGFFVISALAISSGVAHAATFTVNNNGDASDASAGNGTCATAGAVCTLRAAIEEANALSGADTINFSIGTGLVTISPTSDYQNISTPITFDATTQVGFSGTPLIEINGTDMTQGLSFTASTSSLRGFIFNRFADFNQRAIGTSGTAHVTIAGNYFGTDATGNAVSSNYSNIVLTSSNNVIGGTNASDRNIIGGATLNGLDIDGGAGTGTGNIVEGNYIGLGADGSTAVPNTVGIILLGGTSGNTIGGDTADERNIISGNSQWGIDPESSLGDSIIGNYIGTNPAGTAAIPNASAGIAPAFNTSLFIGGVNAGEGNVISGNGDLGIDINTDNTGVVIRGNIIGLNAAGTAALPNSGAGISIIHHSRGNTIGGTTSAARNIISGNGGDGILIANGYDVSDSNVVQGNYIGLNAAGTAAIANGSHGIVADSSSNSIGGSATGAGNVISGNTSDGILLQSGASSNTIAGNTIGLAPDGSTKIANGRYGVAITGAGSDNNVIGGTVAGARNVISGNVNYGIYSLDANGTEVRGNYIGTDAAGTTGITASNYSGVVISNGANPIVSGNSTAHQVIAGNLHVGLVISGGTGASITGVYFGVGSDGTTGIVNNEDNILIDSGASSATIGGPTSAERNIITNSNTGSGIKITGSSTHDITIIGNYIGLDASGAAQDNAYSGVFITSGSHHNTIGGTSAATRNVIAGNLNGNITVSTAAHDNLIEGNYIGTNTAGTSGISGAGVGISLNGAVSTTIGGAANGAGNIISGNNTYGIEVENGSTNSVIYGNYIGLNAAGTGAIANGTSGVFVSDTDTTGTIIGGTSSGQRNIISGNTSGTGITLTNLSKSTTIAGNYIGLNAAGNDTIANSIGIKFDNAGGNSAADTNYINGGNVISGNTSHGIFFSGTAGSDYSEISSNFIGTNPAGTADMGNGGSGIYISPADGISLLIKDNTVSGNAGDGVHIGARNDGNTLHGNKIGTNAAGTAALANDGNGLSIQAGVAGFFTYGASAIIGGSGSGQSNVISGNGQDGILLSGGDLTGTEIKGNLIGLNATGTAAITNGTNGIHINNADTIPIGGSGTNEGNYISGNAANGISLTGGYNNSAIGNVIGLGTDGSTIFANGLAGIYLDSAGTMTIGGSATGESNYISGNTGSGIVVSNSTDSTIRGNFIGLATDDASAKGNGTHGISVIGTSQVTSIGGTGLGEGNTIAHNTQQGVSLANTTNGNSILSNSIYENGELGIDLGADGTTANDALDADTGVNNLQNFPLIAAATTGSVRLIGTINSIPLTDYRIEFFANTSCDASGSGEGQTLINAIPTLSTDGSGDASYDVTFSYVATPGEYITATATDPDANTSEFSTCTRVAVTDLSVGASFSSTTPHEGDTLTYTVTITNGGAYDNTGISLSAPLPAGLSFISASPSQGSYTSGTGAWTIGSLASGENATLTITAKVNTGLVGTTLTSTVDTLVATITDINSANNSTSASLTVQSANTQQSDLAVVSKTVSNTTPAHGTQIQFVIIAKNNGPDAATSAILADPLPAGISIVSSSATQGSYVSGSGAWNIGTLSSGAQVTLTIVATVNADAATSVTNTVASISSSQSDPVSSNNTASASFTVSGTAPAPAPVLSTECGTRGCLVTIPGPQRANSPVTLGPLVSVFSPIGTPIKGQGGFYAFNKNYRGGGYIATGDVDADGADEIIVGEGLGKDPDNSGAQRVRVFEADGTPRGIELRPFAASYAGGLSVAVGDTDGDGKAKEIGVCQASGAQSWCKVIRYNDAQEVLAYWRSFGSLEVGATISFGDVDYDGHDEAIIGPGPNGGPHIQVYDIGTKAVTGVNQGATLKPIQLYPFSPSSRSGVAVTAGDIDPDGKDEIGVAQLDKHEEGWAKLYRYNNTRTVISQFRAFARYSNTGASIKLRDITNDGRAEILVSGGDNGGSHIRSFTPVGKSGTTNFFAYPKLYRGGVRFDVGKW